MTEPLAKPLSDSPWFWLLLFGSMALAMSAAVSPRFAKRYERLERMHQARVEIAARVNSPGGASDVTGPSDAPSDAIALNSGGGSLAPLMYVLAGLMFLAALALIVTRRRAEASS
jgi:hypothetical protein